MVAWEDFVQIPLAMVRRPAGGQDGRAPRTKTGEGRAGRARGQGCWGGARGRFDQRGSRQRDVRVNSSSLGSALLESEVSVVVCPVVCLIIQPGHLRNQQLSMQGTYLMWH